MPSLKMKTKLSTGSLRERKCLGVCQKSSTITKPHVTTCRQIVDINNCIRTCQGCLDDCISLSAEVYPVETEDTSITYLQELATEGNSGLHKQPSSSIDPDSARIMDAHEYSSNLETIFSPALDPIDSLTAPNMDTDAGSSNDFDLPALGIDESDDGGSSSDNQTCNVSDFFISDMLIANIPFDGTIVSDEIKSSNLISDYKCAKPSVFFDTVDDCMILPFLEDSAVLRHSDDIKSCVDEMTDSDSASLYLAISQIRSCERESNHKDDLHPVEDFHPQFIKHLPELSDVVSNFQLSSLPEDPQRKKSITLVLDLDETLVHSMLEPSDDADFTFNVFFDMKEHTVYVKQRPHLHTFLERVAKMFEIVIFTASQSIYAAQLLDKLDPEGKLISRRVYRESCVLLDDGYSYVKDLRVLGVDLAKILIIDNSPQVFRLQVNNGIPIKSWFSDPSDCALLSLLPFLETLVDVEDVRPIIAKRFGNME